MEHSSLSSDSSTLCYTSEPMLEYVRQKNGEKFVYLHKNGQTISDPKIIERITSLVIPPAWTDVEICSNQGGHIQAVGIDAKGRKQYIYHPEWTQIQQQHKFDKMIEFGEVLPELRAVIASDMRRRNLDRERVLATVVWLLEHTFIRVGNQEYAKENHSYGLTTLREKHVDVEGKQVTFSFKGKSGVYHEVEVEHPRVKKTIQQCIELPGYEIFQYLNDDGHRHIVDSKDVNEYLHAITGQHFSAKDFRTWGGTSLAAMTLYELGEASSETAIKKTITQAVKEVAQHLQNTPTVCRKYYIHPAVIETYQDDILVPHFQRYLKEESGEQVQLPAEEYAMWMLLKEYGLNTAPTV